MSQVENGVFGQPVLITKVPKRVANEAADAVVGSVIAESGVGLLHNDADRQQYTVPSDSKVKRAGCSQGALVVLGRRIAKASRNAKF